MSLKAGPTAHRSAFGHLCSLVRRDPAFLRVRTALIGRFPWVESIDLDTATKLFPLILENMEREDLSAANMFCRAAFGADLLTVSEFMKEVGLLEARYRFDSIPAGGHFMIQMVVTGGLPRVWEFGDDSIFIWNPKFFIAPGETRDEFLAEVKRTATATWAADVSSARRHGEWAENLHLDDLHRRVEWFFRRTVKDQSTVSIASMAGYSEFTVRRGINQAQRLLGIPIRRGRPKNVRPQGRNKR